MTRAEFSFPLHVLEVLLYCVSGHVLSKIVAGKAPCARREGLQDASRAPPCLKMSLL